MMCKNFSLLDLCFMLVWNDKYTWIARDRHGDLYAYTTKPEKATSWAWANSEPGYCFKIDKNFENELFLGVKWGDRYPTLLPRKSEIIERMIQLLGGLA